MRCKLGDKKLRKYSNKFGIKFIKGLVRGNTDHRVDLFTEDKKCYSIYPTYPDEKNKLYIEEQNGYDLVEVNHL
jgi:hypothetical protein